MEAFKEYRRSQKGELRPYSPGEPMTGISISEPDKAAGSPKIGDMIARNPKNHADKWLVAKQYFEDNFEAVDDQPNPVNGNERQTLVSLAAMLYRSGTLSGDNKEDIDQALKIIGLEMPATVESDDELAQWLEDEHGAKSLYR